MRCLAKVRQRTRIISESCVNGRKTGGSSSSGSARILARSSGSVIWPARSSVNAMRNIDAPNRCPAAERKSSPQVVQAMNGLSEAESQTAKPWRQAGQRSSSCRLCRSQISLVASRHARRR
jgi:hypothetical protein